MTDAAGGGAPYQSLYRRYRPQRFEDVRGQEHVSRALRNAVREGRVAHAYLFSGPRGTGKTSTARILAMALNCAHPEDGEPDGTCDSCVAIRQGSSLDVQELDAASNRGIDEMRDLLSRVALGIPGRWKVYIVDEVHQLTPVAASALLKTLEEPPPHVVFVLATTDPQKVLQTIRSRTQHFEFRLLGSEILAGLLREVNEAAALGVAPEAIDLVVRRGHGSARDALSVLDQVAALGEVDDEAEAVSDIVDALADHDPGRVLVAVAEAVAAGRDPRRLAVDLVEHLRNGFLAQEAPSLVLLADDAAAEAARQAGSLGRAGMVRALEVLGRAAADLRESVEPRVTLEVALVRLADPAADASPEGLARRVERLEERLARLGAAPPVASPRGPVPPPSRSALPGSPEPAGASRSALPGSPEPAGPTPATGPRTAVAPSRPPLGDPPPLPGRRSPGARPALGGVRRQQTPPDAPPAQATPATPGASPPASGPAAGQPAAPAPGGGSPQGSPPSRDELTKLWADQVLPGLPGRIKAYLSAGHFVDTPEGGTAFALPDPGLLARALPLQGELEAALEAAAGVPVPVRLVVEQDLPRPAGAAPDQDAAFYDLDELEDAGAGVVSPEQRLREAFPGAEEVTP